MENEWNDSKVEREPEHMLQDAMAMIQKMERLDSMVILLQGDFDNGDGEHNTLTYYRGNNMSIIGMCESLKRLLLKKREID
jgi:hypothetical protein